MASEDTPGPAQDTNPPAGNPPASNPPAIDQPENAERRGITVRRAPRYVPFLILGGLVGFAVAAIIAFALPGDDSYDPSSIFGFFMILFGAGGVILGAIAALVLDRLSVKRARHAVVEAVPGTETENDTQDGPGSGPQS